MQDKALCILKKVHQDTIFLIIPANWSVQSPFRHLKDLGMGIHTLHLDELLSFVHWLLLILLNLKRMKNYVLLHPTKYKDVTKYIIKEL